jgi:hypothetical protein
MVHKVRYLTGLTEVMARIQNEPHTIPIFGDGGHHRLLKKKKKKKAEIAPPHKHHTMNTCGLSEMKINLFLISALYGEVSLMIRPPYILGKVSPGQIMLAGLLIPGYGCEERHSVPGIFTELL